MIYSDIQLELCRLSQRFYSVSSKEWDTVELEEKKRLDYSADDGEFWWVKIHPVNMFLLVQCLDLLLFLFSGV